MEPLCDAYHGDLDDVGCGALYGSVDGVAFCESPYGGVGGVDVAEVAPSPEQCLGVAEASCAVDALLHVGVYAWVGEEVVVDELLCFAAADAESLCESEG